MLLEISDLSVFYGDIRAVDGLSLSLKEGELVSVIGANGAGKSSLLNCIMGIVPRKNGSISFSGTDISSLPVHKRAAKGIRFVPERARVFPRLSVYENILTGAYGIRSKIDFPGKLQWLYSLFPVLEERRNQLASTLSGGEQQMLAIARGMMSRPRLLMLDEMSLGLMPSMVEKMMETIIRVNKAGTTVLLVEQLVQEALEISHRGYVLQTGRIVRSGAAEELMGSDEVRKAYMGM